MNLAIWHKSKSNTMEQIRLNLKKKAAPGQPTPSRKEANKIWREEILGILSEDQKKDLKSKRQQNSQKKRRPKFYEETDDENVSD
jgi:hypothetical protein